MQPDEKIQAHLVSVWREPKKFLSIGGKEGMLVLTNKHLMFIHKTEAKMKWWQAVTQRQVVTFLKSKSFKSPKKLIQKSKSSSMSNSRPWSTTG